MDEKLKPCPFCGGEAEERNFGPDGKLVVCTGCEIGTNFFDTMEQAVAAWNSRPERGEVVTREAIQSAIEHWENEPGVSFMEAATDAVYRLQLPAPVVAVPMEARAQSFVNADSIGAIFDSWCNAYLTGCRLEPEAKASLVYAVYDHFLHHVAEKIPAPVDAVASVEISPHILRFGILMNEKLVKNRYKGGWEDCSPEWLVVRMGQELGEVAEAIKQGKEPREVALECADVANFAMMVAEVVGGSPDAHLLATTKQAPDVEKMREAVDLLRDLTPEEPCRYDHNGNCQEHSWFGLNGDKCPVEKAKEFLSGHQ